MRDDMLDGLVTNCHYRIVSVSGRLEMRSPR